MATAASRSSKVMTPCASRYWVRGPRAEASLRSQTAVDSVMVISVRLVPRSTRAAFDSCRVRLVPRPTRAAASGRCASPDAVGGDRLLKESACLAPSRGERGGHDDAGAMAALHQAGDFLVMVRVDPGDVVVDDAGAGAAAEPEPGGGGHPVV